MNMFLESFSDSLHIYKIPKPISYTKNTLIMTYESSTKFEDIECSEYIRSKIIRFLAIFFWNSHLHNICHEDIHKGNWGVQLNDNKIKLVIYDYGLCARLLGGKTILFELLQNIFVDNGDTRKDIDAKILDNIKDLIHICVNDIEKEIVSGYIDNIFKDKSMLIPDAKVYVRMLFECAKINKKLVDTSLLKIILVYSQLQKFIDEYYAIVQYPEQEINQSDSYRISIPDNYSLCKTEDICEFYRNDCLKKLDTKNESYDSVFLFTSENIKNNQEFLKNMIKKTDIKN